MEWQRRIFVGILGGDVVLRIIPLEYLPLAFIPFIPSLFWSLAFHFEWCVYFSPQGSDSIFLLNVVWICLPFHYHLLMTSEH